VLDVGQSCLAFAAEVESAAVFSLVDRAVCALPPPLRGRRRDAVAPPARSLAETQREVESLRSELLQVKEGSGELSAVECRAFAEKVVELTVPGQTGAAAEMARSMIDAMRPEMEKECLEKGTRPEIECALRVRSLDELERCDSSKTKTGRPTERTCRAFADKVVDLTVLGQEGAAADKARSMIEAMRPEMVKECLEKGTSSEIACALKVALDDLERCDGV